MPALLPYLYIFVVILSHSCWTAHLYILLIHALSISILGKGTQNNNVRTRKIPDTVANYLKVDRDVNFTGRTSKRD